MNAQALTDVDTTPDWLDSFEDLVDRADGTVEALGMFHTTVRVERGARLLVVFECVEGILERGGAQLPTGWRFAEKQGWSYLGVFAERTSWFRDPQIMQFFDRADDDAFFDGFEKVIFWGEGAAGYAACCYSVTAPGATVLALRPQATMDADLVPWETRYPQAASEDFTGRYAYAPELTDAAWDLYLLHDPSCEADARHAALFDSDNVTFLHCWHTGEALGEALRLTGTPPTLFSTIAEGTFSAARFYSIMRRRRNRPRYLRALIEKADARGHKKLALAACRYGAENFGVPYFIKRLKMAANSAPGIKSV